MQSHRIVVLLTDFGLQDGYVGIMKGAIAQIDPRIPTIDLSHAIQPQNIAAGRFCLMNAYAYFPPDTVYVAVVDPGVGSQRRGVAIAFEGGFLVGPDNGLFSGILSLSRAIAAVELTNSQYWRTSYPSLTFHGRDIFAPVGAYLAVGVPLAALGEEIDIASLGDLNLPSFRMTATGIIGFIQYIDIFGNLITNIPGEAVGGKIWSVIVGDLMIKKGQTYSDVEREEIISFIGSHGWLEIAVNGGNAKLKLGVDEGEEIGVLWGEFGF